LDEIGAEGHEMADDRHQRVDHTGAERLVSGERVGPQVADLIARATIPPRPDELSGEERAVAAFRAALQAPPRRVRARVLRGVGVTARWAGVKVVVVACLAVAGGLAVASVAGVVPNPLIDERPVATRSPSNPATTQAPVPAVVGSSASTAGPSSLSPSQPPFTDADLPGLCRAYAEAFAHNNLRDNPSFARLAEAAGGAEHVDAYCLAVLNADSGTSHSPQGNSPNHEPKDHSTDPPSPHLGKATQAGTGSSRPHEGEHAQR
jgi:hypothetical protein